MPKTKNQLDLKVELYDFIPHGKFQRGRMRLLFTGEDANSQFVNSIGRIMTDRIPTYAFARELIKVERIDPESGYRDSVAVNHDMITLGLKNIPVSNVDPGISYLHEKFWKNVDYLDPNREKHESEKVIELNLDVRNTQTELTDDDSYLPVTTNDMQIFIDSEEVKLFDKDYPYTLLTLKPKEQIRLSAKAVLGVGLRNCCWQAASNYAIDEETEETEEAKETKEGDNSVILMFKASSRFDEYILMERALEYYKERTELITSMMEKMYLMEEEQTEAFIALINGEDYTIGTPLTYELQSHPDVLKASCGLPDNLVDQIKITIDTDNPDKMIDIIKESSKNLINKIETVQKQFAKIREETYSKYLDKNGKSLFYDYDLIREEDPVKSKSTSKSVPNTKSNTKSKSKAKKSKK